MLEDAAAPRAADAGARLRDRSPASGRAVFCLDAGLRDGREQPRTPARFGSAGGPGLRHLHLGLDRAAQGRADRRTARW